VIMIQEHVQRTHSQGSARLSATEVIHSGSHRNAGHLCIFLPKFHCELKFIEYFWGKVKKYLRDNCDGTFNILKTNMPLAMQSVQLSTIKLWEHRMHHWMDAYRTGLDTNLGCIMSGLPIQFNKIQVTDVRQRCWHVFLTDGRS
jgi:hypothetical protein